MPRERSAPSLWAEAAHDVLDMNRKKGGAVGRHAIAFAFVYALLDLADAIRGLR